MKLLVYIGLLAFMATGCASSRGMAEVDKPGSPNIVNEKGGDQEEYELTIIDPGFQRWYSINGRPADFHTKNYYEQWNHRYVIQWNQLVNQQGLRRTVNYPFENHIDYDANIDYGIALNHELYWYFRYIEAQYGNYYNFGFGRGNRIL